MIAAASTDADVARYIAMAASDRWKLGWRYIYGQPESRCSPRILTIGLNPGGGRDDRAWHDDAHLDQRASPNIINAYFDERWGAGETLSPLQQQLAHLRDLNAEIPLNKWLSFQFVPFRSPGWADLPNKNEAISIGEKLLPWVLATARPALTVGFGLAPVARRLLSFLDAELVETSATGWGTVEAQVYRSPTYGKIVLLPHLSRYRVSGRRRFADEKRLLRVNQE